MAKPKQILWKRTAIRTLRPFVIGSDAGTVVLNCQQSLVSFNYEEWEERFNQLQGAIVSNIGGIDGTISILLTSRIALLKSNGYFKEFAKLHNGSWITHADANFQKINWGFPPIMKSSKTLYGNRTFTIEESSKVGKSQFVHGVPPSLYSISEYGEKSNVKRAPALTGP